MLYYDAPVHCNFTVQLKQYPYPSPMNTPPSAPSSPVPIPISFEKAQRIHMWRLDVERCRPSSSNPFPMEPLMDPFTPDSPSGFHPFQSEFGFAGTPNGLPLELYYWPQEEADMDRWTVVNDGDPRLAKLPHPGANPLMTADVHLLEQEYVRVLKEWNAFEAEKCRAEKMLRGAATPDNIERVFMADHAVESAGTAARYVEAHARTYGVHGNFEALFFNYYQPGEFFAPQENYGWFDAPQPSPTNTLSSHSPFGMVAPQPPQPPAFSELAYLQPSPFNFAHCVPTWNNYNQPFASRAIAV